MSQYKRNDTLRKRLRAQCQRTRAACHICGHAIDYTLRTPDPNSFELDHVQALARGGEDAPDNLRPAHRLASATVPSVPVPTHPSSGAAAR